MTKEIPVNFKQDANGEITELTITSNYALGPNGPFHNLAPEKKKGIPKGAPNPKDLVGAKKVDLTLIPSSSLLHCAMAMMNGAERYGPYNFRDYPVEARTYVAAAKRHLDAWLDRQENAPDSGVHHLGHAMACCAILIDCLTEGNLIDNRPPSKGGYHRLLEELNSQCKANADRKKEERNVHS